MWPCEAFSTQIVSPEGSDGSLQPSTPPLWTRERPLAKSGGVWRPWKAIGAVGSLLLCERGVGGVARRPPLLIFFAVCTLSVAF